jgi:hypothetical protein
MLITYNNSTSLVLLLTELSEILQHNDKYLVSNAKELTVNFAHKMLTPIRGVPTYASMGAEKISSINGTSRPLRRGDHHRYLGLVLSDTERMPLKYLLPLL